MHIGFLTHEYPPVSHGGIGTFVQSLARRLVAAGHAVSVIGTWRRPHDAVEEDAGVRIYRVRASHLPTARFIPNAIRVRSLLRRLHRTQPFDLIEAAEIGFAFEGRRAVAPRIIRMNGGHHFFTHEAGRSAAPWRAWMERRSFGHAEFVCAASRYVATQTARCLQLDEARIRILHNFVDEEVFAPLPAVPENPLQIFFMGTLCEKKGIRQLIQAMPEVRRSFPGARLVVAGRDLHDPVTHASFRDTVLRPILPADPAAHPEFLGPVAHERLPALIAASAVCVLPSHAEALPLAWLEVLAMGRPLIGGDIGPGREIITDGVTGLLRDPHSPDALAGGIKELLGDAARRADMGRRARAHVLQHFSARAMVPANIAFYAACLAAGAAARGRAT